MRVTLAVARDLLREALQRRWILALGLAITAIVLVLGMALRMEVVDGALAATRLFGRVVHHDIRSAAPTSGGSSAKSAPGARRSS